VTVPCPSILIGSAMILRAVIGWMSSILHTMTAVTPRAVCFPL